MKYNPGRVVIFAFSLSLLSVCAIPSFAGDEHAIVGIYSKLTDGRSRKGTGFVISSNGKILTAYHVIVGARDIRLFTYERDRIDNVLVESIYPDEDLALLKMPQISGQIYLSLERTPLTQLSDEQRDIKTIGHPYGIPFQQYTGTLSYPAIYQNSQEFWRGGHQIFQHDLPIIPLDITSDKGLSGAPVIHHGKAIGVLSGALYEGRGISWAIPVSALDNTRQKISYGVPARDINSWPSSGLMSSTWVGLEEHLGEDFEAVKALASLEGAADSLEHTYQEGINFARAALSYAATSFSHLSDGITSSSQLYPDDLDVYLASAYELNGTLRELSNLAQRFQRASNRIEDARVKLRDKVLARLSEDPSGPANELLKSRLNNIKNSKEAAAAIFHQFITDIVAGQNQMAEGLKHRSHLYTIQEKYRTNPQSRQARLAYDEEIREILELVRISVTLIKNSLEAIVSQKFMNDSTAQLKKLYGILYVSEIIIYSK